MPSSRILLICDSEELSRYLREALIVEAGNSVVSEENIRDGLKSLKSDGFDLVIIRQGILGLEPTDLIRDFKKIDPDCVIICLRDDSGPEREKEFLGLGVYDFVPIPVNKERLFLLVSKGAQLHSLLSINRKAAQGLKEQNQALEKQNIFLGRRIEESTKSLSHLYEDLRSTYMRTIKVLAQAIDARDHYTHSHSETVAKYAEAIAAAMDLSVKEVETIREACELHDLGKIGIQDNILGKPGPLTAGDWDQIKRHPQIGAQILEPLTFLNDVIELVRQHHEHYDGTGYPDGRKGEDIILGARIIHLADAYESMRSARSYRRTPLSKEEAVAEIKKNNGTQFDPKVVEAFLRVVDKL